MLPNMTMPSRPARHRRAVLAALAAIALPALVSGCSAEADGPPVAAEELWEIEGLGQLPIATGAHHWLSQDVRQQGVGWGSSYDVGPLVVHDARTGEQVDVPGSADASFCARSSTMASDGRFTVLERDPSDPDQPCTVLRTIKADGTTGWTRTFPELEPFSNDIWMAMDDEVIVLVGTGFAARCVTLDDPALVPEDECTEAADHHTLADLPDLTLPDGTPVPVVPAGLPGHELYEDFTQGDAERRVVGRTDDVLLVTGTLEGKTFYRAHDLRSGTTLWQRDGLVAQVESPHWGRAEAYFVAPSGIVHASYEAPSSESEEITLLLTTVEERTGKDGRTFATAEGAFFHHAYGDVLVALTHEERGLAATITGYRLPKP